MTTTPEILRECAETFEQRNKLYGDNYKHFGKLMQGIFPRGLTIESVDDWNRLSLLMQAAAKLSRYGQSFTEGHVDSAHDAAVYAAMLEELTRS